MASPVVSRSGSAQPAALSPGQHSQRSLSPFIDPSLSLPPIDYRSSPGPQPTAPAPKRTSTHKRRRSANNTVDDLTDPSSQVDDSKKMFVCKGYGNCKMAFSRSEHLARHVRKHTGERPFKCHCGRDFSRLDNLRQHAQTVHSDTPDKNTAMMARLQSVHNALSTSSRAKRAKQNHNHTQSLDSGLVSYGSLGQSVSPLMSEYSPMPNENYFSRPLMLDSYVGYSDSAPAYSHYSAGTDFGYDRPTLPPISALIPRSNATVSIPSPLLPSQYQDYVGAAPYSMTNMPSVLAKPPADSLANNFYFPSDLPAEYGIHTTQAPMLHEQPRHMHEHIQNGQLLFYPPRMAQSSDRSTSYGAVMA